MILSIPNNLAGVGADIIKKKKNGYKSGVLGNWAMLRSKGYMGYMNANYPKNIKEKWKRSVPEFSEFHAHSVKPVLAQVPLTRIGVLMQLCAWPGMNPQLLMDQVRHFHLLILMLPNLLSDPILQKWEKSMNNNGCKKS